MASLEDVGERDGWRCWVCDQPVDPDLSVNDDQGPSVDRFAVAAAPSKKAARTKEADPERLAHRACNTRKGAVRPTIAWPADIIVFDPAPILQTVERLVAKGGREMVVRCASRSDADAISAWLVDRLARLVPSVVFTTAIGEGGGQHLVSLLAPRP